MRLSGLPPHAPRRRRGAEAQRLAALSFVTTRAAQIRAAARAHGLSAEAVAGAILWDPLENPYRRSFLRLGPGRVHPVEVRGASDAERAECAQLLPGRATSPIQRLRRLRDPTWAIAYVAAMLALHARNYAQIAGIDIRDDPAILCTLYHGGNSEGRARRFAERRAKDPEARPIAADEMGPWVGRNLEFISSLLDRGASAGASGALPAGDRHPTAATCVSRA